MWRTVGAAWSGPDYFMYAGARNAVVASSSVDADATAAHGEEDKVLGQNGRALCLACRLAKLLPGADDPTLEVLARRHADNKRQTTGLHITIAQDIPRIRDLTFLEGDRGGGGNVAGGHRVRGSGGVGMRVEGWRVGSGYSDGE